MNSTTLDTSTPLSAPLHYEPPVHLRQMHLIVNGYNFKTLLLLLLTVEDIHPLARGHSPPCQRLFSPLPEDIHPLVKGHSLPCHGPPTVEDIPLLALSCQLLTVSLQWTFHQLCLLTHLNSSHISTPPTSQLLPHLNSSDPPRIVLEQRMGSYTQSTSHLCYSEV